MNFLPVGKTASRVVPGCGPPSAKIVGVGEAPGAEEDRQLRPFVGMAGSVLEQCLHAANLIRSEIYLTNVVKVRPTGNDISPYYSTSSGQFTAAGEEWIRTLQDELDQLSPNVIVAIGDCARAALTGIRRPHVLMKHRGYFFPSVGLKRVVKVLPTIHPAAALRGQYLYRHIIATDFRKAREFSNEPGVVLPERQVVFNFSSAGEVLEWLAYYEKQPLVSFDIEVLNFEVACISFSSSPDTAISVPFDRRWTEHDELLIWRGVQRVLGNQYSVKVCQNGIFDIHFLLTRCGIEVRGPIRDTMICHHVMYPELPKSLQFLTSVYGGAQPYYKDIVKFNNVKEEA